MRGMCVACGKPANSPFVDPRFCHICGCAFEIGRQEAIQQLDPEPVIPCDCTIDGGPGIDYYPAPTGKPEDYMRHVFGCPWAEWAIRQINRRDQQAQRVDP